MTQDEIIATLKEAGFIFSSDDAYLLTSLDGLDVADLVKIAELTKAPLQAEMDSLKAQLMQFYTNGDRTMTMNGRNFEAGNSGYIQDNNFDFDAGLQVSGDFVDDEKYQYAQMIATALNTAVAKEGYVLAPIEPTIEMKVRGAESLDIKPSEAASVYKAMIEAALKSQKATT